MKILLYSLTLTGFVLAGSSSVAQNINAFAGNHSAGYSGDGSAATSAKCYAPLGAAADNAGNVYFCELGNSVIRKVSPSGVISTVAGTGVQGFSGDSGLATAALINQPTSVAVDDTGNIYFTDDGNNRIRKINTAGVIYTIAGTGIAGFSDNNNARLAQLNGPSGIAVGRTGKIYIADAYNHAIRMIDSGKLKTICGDGTPGSIGNGGDAYTAKLNYPKGVCLDTAGNLFIVDQGNSMIRRINLSGIITVYAGTGVPGYSGNGGLGYNAQISAPTEVAVDKSNNLYIADFSNHVIRKVKPSGTIYTVVGNGTNGYSGDGGRATDAEMSGPYGVAVDNNYKLYVTDEINHVVRVVDLSPTGIDDVETTTLHIYPNPATDKVNIELPASAENVQITVCDISGRQMMHNNVPGTNATTELDVHDLPNGLYVVTLIAGNEIQRTKLNILK